MAENIDKKIEELVTTLSHFVEEVCQGRDPSHGHEHMKTVYQNSLENYKSRHSLTPETYPYFRALTIAAWLHDVADHKYVVKNPELALKVVKFINEIEPDKANTIINIIEDISFSKEKVLYQDGTIGAFDPASIPPEKLEKLVSEIDDDIEIMVETLSNGDHMSIQDIYKGYGDQSSTMIYNNLKRICDTLRLKNLFLKCPAIIYWEGKYGKEFAEIRQTISDEDKCLALGQVGLDRCIEYTSNNYYENHGTKIDHPTLRKEVSKHADEKLFILYKFIRTEYGKNKSVRLHNELVFCLDRFIRGLA